MPGPAYAESTAKSPSRDQTSDLGTTPTHAPSRDAADRGVQGRSKELATLGGYDAQALALAPQTGTQPGVDPREEMRRRGVIRNALSDGLANLNIHVWDERRAALSNFRGDLLDSLDHDVNPSIIASVLAAAIKAATSSLIGLVLGPLAVAGPVAKALIAIAQGSGGSAVEGAVLGALVGRKVDAQVFIQAATIAMNVDALAVRNATLDVFSMMPHYVGPKGEQAAVAFNVAAGKAFLQAASLQYGSLLGQWSKALTKKKDPRWRKGRLDKTPAGVLSIEVDRVGNVVGAEIDGVSDRMTQQIIAQNLTIDQMKGMGVRIWSGDRIGVDIDGDDRGKVTWQGAESRDMVQHWMDANGHEYGRHPAATMSTVYAFAALWLQTPVRDLGMSNE